MAVTEFIQYILFTEVQAFVLMHLHKQTHTFAPDHGYNRISFFIFLQKAFGQMMNESLASCELPEMPPPLVLY